MPSTKAKRSVIESERNECADSAPRLRGKQVSWRHIVRHRVSFNHDARDIKWQDERVAMERKGGDILSLAT